MFHDGCERRWHVGSRDTFDRRVQPPEGLLGNNGCHIAGPAAGQIILLDDHQPASLVHRFQDQLLIQRHQRARVDDFGLDALLGQHLGGRQSPIHGQQLTDDSHIPTLPPDNSLANRHQVLLIRDIANGADSAFLRPGPLAAVEQFVLEDDHRIVIPDGALEQAFGIISGGRRQHFQARHVNKKGFETLSVLGTARCSSYRRPHHQWHLDRATRHIGHLGCLIRQLVHGQEQEVAVLHVGNGPQAGHRCANGDSSQAQLRDRRV